VEEEILKLSNLMPQFSSSSEREQMQKLQGITTSTALINIIKDNPQTLLNIEIELN